MYKIVYSVVDKEELQYTNELMISLQSIKRLMPDQKIVVVVDKRTYNFYQNKQYPILKEAEVIPIEIPDTYSQKAKSRYLKTSLRKYVTGDFLFLDTDTVICKQLPEKVSNAHIAMALDYNCSIPDRLDKDGVKALNKLCGLPFEHIENYYNTGVIWVRDSQEAAEFYRNWHNKWKETLDKGFIFDQPSANYILRKKMYDFQILDNIWNLQISVIPTPIGELKDAYAIHYFNVTDSAYLLCDPSIKRLGYNDECILRILGNPTYAFSRCALIKLDDKTIELLNSKSYKLLKMIQVKAHNLFDFNEKIIEGLNSITKFARKKTILGD